MRKLSEKNLKIAIPNKGRLSELSLNMLRDAGLNFEIHNRGLFSSCLNYDIDILYARAIDIPEYVKDGVVDLGITGLDLLVEKIGKRQNEVEKVLDLNYGKCSLVIAAPLDSKIKTVRDLDNKKITTSFPRIAADYFKSQGLNVEAIEVAGAVEITTSLGIADAILDIVSTGSTMKMNRLRPIETVMKSEAILIKNSNNESKIELVESLISMIQSVLYGRSKKYIMMNATEDMLENIHDIIPGLTSPTVIKLAKEGHIAVHSVVDAEEASDIAEKLKKAGASGILIMPIEKIIF